MTIVEEMRHAFDQAFTKPEPPPKERPVRLILLRAQDSLLAIRSDEIEQIVRSPALADVPGAAPAFVGIGAVRGTVVGFYSLAAVAAGRTSALGSWAALCGRTRTIGLVFDEIVASVDRSVEELKEMLEIGGHIYTLIDVQRIIAEIEPRGE